MSKTVVLLNPYGTDVTPYVNHTSGYAQLMNGTVASISDTVYTLPYNNNVSTAANITTGAGLLDTKLNGTSGQILVFGYSEGCQIADYWLSNQALTTSVSPVNVSFLLIGNANRKYGGFAYGRSEFNTVGYTGGKPDSTPFTVIDFVRQYDPIGDFPTATAIVDALTGLASVGSDGNAMTGAMQDVATALASGPYSNALTNCVAGLALVHTGLGVAGTGYMSVTVTDPTNLTLADGNITWIWSPTYPVPMLGVGATLPQSDYTLRTQIEQAYSRPVTIPMPDYSANSGWSIEPFPVPVNPAPVTGWWAELLISCHITITPSVSAAKGKKVIITLVVTPSVSAIAHAVHPYTVAFTITPSVTVHAAVKLPRGGTTVISPQVSAAARLIKPINVSKTITPTIAPVLKDRDGVAVTITPSVTAAGTVTRHPTAALTVSPHLSASATVIKPATVSKTIIPTVSGSGVVTRKGVVSKTVTPTVTASAAIVKRGAVAVSVTPSVSVAGTAKTGANIPITVTPTVTAAGRVTRYAAVTVTIPPTVSGSGKPIEAGMVSKTITPTVTATGVVTRYASVSKTITPSVSAVGKDRDGVGITVTPHVTVSATVTRFATVSKSITPSVAPTPRARVAESVTVTPTVSGAIHNLRTAAVAKTVTPTVTATAVVVKVGNVASTVTPSISAAGSVASNPTYDNSANSGYKSAIASGTAFTFTHTATAGAYAIVGVFCAGLVTGTPTTTSATATVTFGGTAMTSLGKISINNSTADGFVWVFGLASVSGGSNTVSVKFTQSSKTFYGYATSATYTGVTSVGTLATAYGSSTAPSVSVSSASGDMVWGALAGYSVANGNESYSSFSLTQRQSVTTPTTAAPAFIAGDTAGASSVTASATAAASIVWGAAALNLI